MSGVRSIFTRFFIAGLALIACCCVGFAFPLWSSSDPVKFACYLIVALLVSPLKVSLPGITGTLTVNFLFTLLGILELSLPETLLLSVASTVGQIYWKAARRPAGVHVLFNLSQVAVSSTAAYGAYHLVVSHILHAPQPLALIVAAIVHFACNTGATSTIIGLTEGKPIAKVWKESHFWLLPYYLVGAAAAGLVHFLNAHIGWQSSLLVLPPIYLLYRSYRLYLGRLESEKRHAEQVSNLHLRTIEALALAIEAKDQTTGEHLQRVRVYATELAKELGLSEDETEALRAASVLHDIGKLAVPEHIISKPGRLTPEEFDKMKIHPIVGAEILEQVNFPYPVVPIVRAHHEKWDGSGYPYGLAAEEIPIGARILTAVDCLDALASDRQYRKALPLDEAMARVVAEAGKSFDPNVVAILNRRYVELEKLATEQPLQAPPKLSTDIKVERGLAPDAGFAESAEPTPSTTLARESNTGAASVVEQVRGIVGLAGKSAVRLTVADVAALIALRVRPLVPYESLVLYLSDGEMLIPELVIGENSRLFSSLRIRIGDGLCGWVAQNHRTILNGNPSVEPGYLNDANQHSSLRSALAVPMVAATRVAAVLAVYRAADDAFTADELRTVEVIADGVGMIIADAAKPKALSASAAAK